MSTLSAWVAVPLVGTTYLVLLGLGEWLRWRSLLSTDDTRRVVHIGAGLIALGLPWMFDSAWPVIGLAAPFAVLLVCAAAIGQLKSIHAVARRSVGAHLYPVAIAAIFLLASDDHLAYTASILALALGDAAAGHVGMRYGRHPYTALGGLKSVEGTASACATTVGATAAIWVVSGSPLAAALAAAALTGAVVALVEGASPWGIDNLTVPLAALLATEASGSALVALTVLGAAAACFTVAVLAPVAGTRGDAGLPTAGT